VLALTACAQILIPSDRLSVSSSATPTRISSKDSVPVIVAIRVSNHRLRPVRIDLGGPPWQTLHDISTSTGQGFALFIRAPDGRATNVNLSTWGRSELGLGPWQSVRWVDTVWINTARHPLAPGTYQIITGFGRTEARPITLVVTPSP